jgi:DNA-binding transcriptional regulator LsrR (DeoR family)
MASSFDDIVRAIGQFPARKLAQHFGGTRLYVPVTATVEGKIAKSIGVEAAELLSERYGGSQIDIPFHPDRTRHRLDSVMMKRLLMKARIREAVERGLKQALIARDLGVSARHLRRILSA